MPTKARSGRNITKSDKWQKIFTPQILASVALCLFCLVMTIICFLNPGTKETSVTSPVQNMQPLDVITPQKTAVQKFTSDNDYVKFGLYYANFSNYIQGGNIYINIENSQQESREFTYNISSTADNSFLYIDYPVKKYEIYTISICISDDAQGITFFTTTAENFDATLIIDKKPQDASIIMAFVNETKDYFLIWYFIMVIALTSCYIVLKIDKGVYAQKV